MYISDLSYLALKTAVQAGRRILDFYNGDYETVIKEDHSPLTEADVASNAIINQCLADSGIPLISEENKQLAYEIRKDWERYWIIDPLDGTKEFIKGNGEFTVNIALCERGQPKMGVIYVPFSGELYVAEVTSGKAFKKLVPAANRVSAISITDEDRIYPQKQPTDRIKVVGSRSHMNKDTQQFIESLKKDYDDVEIVSKGSSLKFCLVAEGKAQVYPRFAPTMEWDTAAGHAICNAVGLEVIDRSTNKPLQYNKKVLLNPSFIVR